MTNSNNSTNSNKIIYVIFATAISVILLVTILSNRQTLNHKNTIPNGTAPLKGEMISFQYTNKEKIIRNINFFDADRNQVRLRDWDGKIVLLNLWASWCHPCRKEIPSLERLQQKINNDNFTVLLVNVDRDTKKAKKLLNELKIEKLQFFSGDNRVLQKQLSPIPGLPVTILVNRNGVELGRLFGDAKWDSPEAISLINHHLEQN